MRYNGGKPPLMIYTAHCAAMIYLCPAVDKKRTKLCFVLFLAYPTGFEPAAFRVGV